MNIKIESYINSIIDNMNDAVFEALSKVDTFDKFNNDGSDNDIITKLYYITPKNNNIMVVCSEDDRLILGAESRILFSSDINEYPLYKLPSNIVKYKELIITKGNDINAEDIIIKAKEMADNELTNNTYKLPLIKIINYNNTSPSYISLGSDFTSTFSIEDNAFNSDAAVW